MNFKALNIREAHERPEAMEEAVVMMVGTKKDKIIQGITLLQPFFEKYDYIGNEISDNLFDTGLCLPSDSKMTKEQQDRVIDTIKRLFINA